MTRTRNKCIQRMFSLLLVTALIMSLMPNLPASAAEWDPVDSANYSKFTTVDALKESSHTGIVFRYVDTDSTNPIPKDYVRVDFGVYKHYPVNTISFNLKFDPAIVGLSGMYNGAPFPIVVDTESTPNVVADSSKMLTFLPFKYMDGVYEENIGGPPPKQCTYFFDHSNVNAKSDYPVFKLPTANSVIITNEGTALTGHYSLTFNTDSANPNQRLDPYVEMLDTPTKGYFDTSAFTEPVFIAYTYFKVADSSRLEKAFSLYQTIPNGVNGGYTGATQGTNAGKVHAPVAMLGFPVAAPVVTLNETEITVQDSVTTTKKIDNAAVTITRTSTESNPFTTITDAVTDTNGIVRAADAVTPISLPAGTYDFQVTKSGYNTQTKSIVVTDVTSPNKITGTVSLVKSAANTYPVTITVLDAENHDQPLKGATLTILGATATTDAAGTATVTGVTADTGKVLTLTAPGYETITSTLTVAEGGGLSLANPPAGITVKNGTALAATMKKIRTAITLPLPIPKNGETAIHADNGKDLTLTISKNLSGTSPTSITLPRTVTTIPNGENEKLTIAPESGATAITSITATLKLPAGNYTVALGGTGLNTEAANLNVLSDGAKVFTNLGGVVTNSGKTVTGGYTVPATVISGTSATADLLTGTGGKVGGILTDDGTSVSLGGTTTEPATGGFLANNGTTDAPILKAPTTITDPVYIVDVTENKPDSKVTSMTAKVYLKNLKATSGTFGLRYDTTIFDTTTLPTPTLGAGLSFVTANQGLVSPENKAGYSTFSWSGTPATEAAGKYLIATYTLPVLDGADLATLFTDKSVYIMDYSKTANATTVAQKTVKEYWRTAGITAADYGENKHASILSDAKMLGGGYYQVGHDGGSGVQLYDAGVQFSLPPYGNARIDLNVKDPAGKAISGAMVSLYTKDDTLTTDPTTPSLQSAVTDANGDAYLSVKDGNTYEYNIKKSTHWTYPTGTASNTTDLRTENIKIDVSTNIVTTNNGTTDVTHANGLVPRVMSTRTYHQTALDTTKVTTAAKIPTIAGSTSAYNDIDYAFNLQPPAGYEWTATTKGDLTVQLYEAAVVSDTVNYKSGTATTLTAKWSAAKNAYIIPGTSIKGDPPTDLSGVANPDLVRAGDIVVELTEQFVDNNFSTASYTVSASAGTKGTVSAKDKHDTDSVYTSPGSYTPGTPVAAIVETISNGHQSSASYTFAPDTGTPAESERPNGASTDYELAYVIDQVYVNGVPVGLTDYQRIHGYTYKFTQVKDNQNISATFSVAAIDGDAIPPTTAGGGTTPSSNPIVSVLIGQFGKAELTYTEGKIGVVSNGSLDCIVDIGGTFTAVITPDSGYIIDKILVNGTPETVSNTASHTVTKANLKGNEHHNIIAMFKSDEAGAPSIQVAVFAKAGTGMGRIFAPGIAIYNVNDQPTYNITPDSGWDKYDKKDPTKGALMLKVGNAAATDVSGKIAGTAGNYTYTLDPLTADTELTANFMEKNREVIGAVRFWDGNAVNNALFAKGDVAKITFTREANSATGTDKLILTTTTASGRTAEGVADFKISLPVGKWTVLVEKQGYLDYTITDFELSTADVEATGAYYFGGTSGGTPARKIAPIVGDASGEGDVISFFDAAQVAAGLAGSSDKSKIKGDIDENTFGTTRETNVIDMGYVKVFYNKEAVTETYAVFLSTNSVSHPAN